MLYQLSYCGIPNALPIPEGGDSAGYSRSFFSLSQIAPVWQYIGRTMQQAINLAARQLETA